VFGVNELNGAVLALPNPPAVEKKDARESGQPFVALSTDEAVHSKRVLEYFLAAGVPAEEVGGTHVTTLMAGYAPKSQRTITSKDSHFVAYDTHLERVVAGIPVVGSHAWARFNSDDEVVQEGAFWPAIAADVVAAALQLQAIANDPDELREYRARIEKESPIPLRDSGRVIIQHTPSIHDQPTTALAAYEVASQGPKPHSVLYDASGKELRLPMMAVAPSTSNTTRVR
jgi:hypothetical protein